jgi:hypothetical protein
VSIFGTIPGALAQLCLLVMMVFPMSGRQAQGETNSSTTQASSLKLTISAKNLHLHPGDTLKLRVEIKNIGYDPIFVYKEIALSTCSVANLRIFPIKGNAFPGPGWACASDCFPVKPNDPAKNPIESVVLRGWTLLPPGYTYSRELPTYPVGGPGRYLIRGDYSSQGLTDGCLTFSQEEVSSLPHQVWKGSVETNSLWIEVTKRE